MGGIKRAPEWQKPIQRRLRKKKSNATVATNVSTADLFFPFPGIYHQILLLNQIQLIQNVVYKDNTAKHDL